MSARPHDLPCLVIVVDRAAEGVSLRIVEDRESLCTILREAHSFANRAEILDLEAVVIDDGEHPRS